MTDLDTRLDRIEAALLKQTEPKPSMLWQTWVWAKPYIIPFIFGMIAMYALTLVPTQSAALVRTTIEQQAATGGAAIPFPSGSPSLTPSTSPPENSTTESTASSLTSTCEPPSVPSPQADSGQTPSTKYYRMPLRRMR